MCRMLAFTGYTKTLKSLLLTFQMLSLHGKSIDERGHEDGWGIGYYGKGVTLFKRAECAHRSEEYLTVVESLSRKNPRVVLAHLRKASPGTPLTDREAHPFQNGNFLFCHNGSLYQKDGSPLGEELDSILYFRKIQKTSLKEAISHFHTLKYTSLTCLLTDGHTIWGYRDYTEKEDYYTLYYTKKESYVLFCSEPIIAGEWVLVGNRELVTVSETLDIETELL